MLRLIWGYSDKDADLHNSVTRCLDNPACMQIYEGIVLVGGTWSGSWSTDELHNAVLHTLNTGSEPRG